MQRALFLDRDGTLVHPSHYPSQPEQLRLYPNIAVELQALQRKGLLLIVITNQSGIARGYFTEADLQRMHEYLKTQFAAQGVFLDALYHCPHHPDGIISELSFRCDCRKPQPGMLLRAAADHNIDLHHSWFVGDILDDVEAGNRAGCRTVLVDLGTEQPPTHFLRCPTFVGRDTCHALQTIRTIEELHPELDLLYRPVSWQPAKSGHKQEEVSKPEEGACTR
jgi:D-glycero-D-manno-heptose 1,7-bisphosphate phosphatase